MTESVPDFIQTCFTGLQSIGATVSIIARSPVPLVSVGWQGDFTDTKFTSELGFALADLAGEKHWPPVRCVTIHQLPNVLRSGCDVEPSDSVFWVTPSPGKALEYGGEFKVMLAFKRAGLTPTFREIPADTPAEKIAELRLTFPTLVPSDDGKKVSVRFSGVLHRQLRWRFSQLRGSRTHVPQQCPPLKAGALLA
jgi:hypothetical protein